MEAEKLEKFLTNALKKGFSKFLEVEQVFFWRSRSLKNALKKGFSKFLEVENVFFGGGEA